MLIPNQIKLSVGCTYKNIIHLVDGLHATSLETTIYSKNLYLNLAIETCVIHDRTNTNCDSVLVWNFHFRHKNT